MAITTGTRQADNSELLRLALRTNGVVSIVGGALTVALTGWLSQQLGIGEPLITAFVGLGIVAVGAAVLFLTMRPLARSFGQIAFIGDVLWVLASLIVVFEGIFPITDAGRWFILAQAVAVAVVAELEFFGLRKMR